MSDEICKSGYGGDDDNFYDSEYPDCGYCGECEICEQLEYRYTWKADGGENMCDHCIELDGTQYKSLGDAPEKPHPNCNCILEENDGFDRRRIIPHPWTGRDAPTTIWGDSIYINPTGERTVVAGWNSLYNRERYSPAGMERLREYERNLEQDRQRIEQARRRIITRERERRASGQTAAATPFQRAAQTPSRATSRSTPVAPRLNRDPIVRTLIIRPHDGPGLGCGTWNITRVRQDGTKVTHAGVDIVIEPGAPVQSLTRGRVYEIRSAAYTLPNRFTTNFNIVTIKTNSGHFIRYFYVNPSVNVDQTVGLGTIIGTDQHRASYSRGMTNHTHVEVRNPRTRNPNSAIRAIRDFGNHINPVEYLQDNYGWIFE